jgi:hypothetical protein
VTQRVNGASFAQELNTQMTAQTLEQAFNDAGAQYGIPPALLKAVAKAESGFNPNARSSAGAIGLMQFMPGTASGMGIDPHDPIQSIYGAAKYLRGLADSFGGDLKLALAGYNAGPGAVKKYGGIPPYDETQNYVARVMNYAQEYAGGAPVALSEGKKSGMGIMGVTPDGLNGIEELMIAGNLDGDTADLIEIQFLARLCQNLRGE